MMNQYITHFKHPAFANFALIAINLVNPQFASYRVEGVINGSPKVVEGKTPQGNMVFFIPEQFDLGTGVKFRVNFRGNVQELFVPNNRGLIIAHF
jgi:hypothetical protein